MRFLFFASALFSCSALHAQTAANVTLEDGRQVLYIYDSLRNRAENIVNDRNVLVLAQPLLKLTTACGKPSPYRALQSPDELQRMPYNRIEDMIPFMSTNTYQQRLGDPVQIGGGR